MAPVDFQIHASGDIHDRFHWPLPLKVAKPEATHLPQLCPFSGWSSSLAWGHQLLVTQATNTGEWPLHPPLSAPLLSYQDRLLI